MKRITNIFVLCLLLPLVGMAQKGRVDIALYSGVQMYGSSGYSFVSHNGERVKFGTGFGIGAQSKYYLGNRLYLATDFYGGTNNNYEKKSHYNVEDPLTKQIVNTVEKMSNYRRDYSITTGIGYDLFKKGKFTLYAQFLAGFGAVEGSVQWYKNNVLNKDAIINLRKVSYVLAPSAGVDFALTEHWKLGMGYSCRILGNADAGHSVFGRITYTID